MRAFLRTKPIKETPSRTKYYTNRLTCSSHAGVPWLPHKALKETQQDEKLILENDIVQKWLEGKSLKKIIYVKKRINVVT